MWIVNNSVEIKKREKEGKKGEEEEEEKKGEEERGEKGREEGKREEERGGGRKGEGEEGEEDHWIPLYDALGLQWNEKEKESITKRFRDSIRRKSKERGDKKLVERIRK